MTAGLTIRVVDPDRDYLGIEICAASSRFAGTTRIYAGLDELSSFADLMAGFPANLHDERTYEFGSPGQSLAGGYVKLRFYCVDRACHAAVGVGVEDDSGRYQPGSAQLSFQVDAAEIDRFLLSLRQIEQDCSGEATLSLAV